MVGSKRHLVTEEKLKFGSSETDREREREKKERKKPFTLIKGKGLEKILVLGRVNSNYRRLIEESGS